MPQNGVHAMVGIAARKWLPQREWLALGLVLGNMFPDLDNLAVAYVTLTGTDTSGLHRTFTHSIFMVLAMFLLFYLISKRTGNMKWTNFGTGFGMGIFMHILLDLVLWFNGVELLWPIRYELNFWGWFDVPSWLSIILDTGEFLAFGFYFFLLGSLARRQNTDTGHQSTSRLWVYVQFVLFIIFTILFFSIGTDGIQYTIFGALYLLSVIFAIVITIRMRRTIELAWQA